MPNADGKPLPAAAREHRPHAGPVLHVRAECGRRHVVTPPVMLTGSSEGQDFNLFPRKQRSSLVETNVNGVKTVFGCSGTIEETSKGADGYCFAFDVASNTVSAILATTAGEGAGIWMAGQGASARCGMATSMSLPAMGISMVRLSGANRS